MVKAIIAPSKKDSGARWQRFVAVVCGCLSRNGSFFTFFDLSKKVSGKVRSQQSDGNHVFSSVGVSVTGVARILARNRVVTCESESGPNRQHIVPDDTNSELARLQTQVAKLQGNFVRGSTIRLGRVALCGSLDDSGWPSSPGKMICSPH